MAVKPSSAHIAKRVATLDAVSLFAFVSHARDRGYPLLPRTRRALSKSGLLVNGAVGEPLRAWVAHHVHGNGLAVTVAGRPQASDLTTPMRALLDAARAAKKASAAKILERMADELNRKTGVWDATGMLAWTAAAQTLTDHHGRATPELLRVLTRVERRYHHRMSRGAAGLFQDLIAMVGGRMHGAIQLPLRKTAYWLAGAQPLAGYQSSRSLPKTADVVIIGAGLVGASAAYHLAREASRGWRVVLLEAGDPASQATGRNGGNFELIPENFFGGYGTYDGFVAERAKFLAAAYPALDRHAIEAQAHRVADTVIRFAITNTKRMLNTIRVAGIACDVSTRGWVRTALNRREEKALFDEVQLINRLGAKAHFLTAHQLRRKYGVRAKFGGRLVMNNGNYHPGKFVAQELKYALEQGVSLYTRTPVQRIESRQPGRHLVHTARGVVSARRVIVATNAFTSELFPELSDIRPFRSQISNYEHVADRLGGVTLTCKDGDLYANFPGGGRYRDARGRRRGTLHVGGGKDTEIRSPHRLVPARAIFEMSRKEVAETFTEAARQPPSRLWAGPMAFVEGRTGMRLPVLGPLGSGVRSGIFIAVWCNGYGGTGCHNAGAGAASWARTGRIPADMPQDVFGPVRLWAREPLFPI